MMRGVMKRRVVAHFTAVIGRYAGLHQVRERDRGLERKADHIGEVAVAFEPAADLRGRAGGLGLEEEQRAERPAMGPARGQSGGGEGGGHRGDADRRPRRRA